jgi:hypothetical protein
MVITRADRSIATGGTMNKGQVSTRTNSRHVHLTLREVLLAVFAEFGRIGW